MWHLLKAEFVYHKKIYLWYSCFLPLIVAWVISPPVSLSPNYLMFVLLFMIVQNWVVFRNKEKRDYLHAKLPLSMNRIALVRILMVIIPIITFFSILALIRIIIKPTQPVDFKNPIIYAGILLFGFSVYYVLRDRLLFIMRNNQFFKFTQQRAKLIVIFVGLLLNILGVITFIKRPSILGDIIKFIMTHNPFASEAGVIIFIILSLVFAYLSLITYNRRHEYLE